MLIYNTGHTKPKPYSSEKNAIFDRYKSKVRRILNGVDDVSLKFEDKQKILEQMANMINNHEPRRTM